MRTMILAMCCCLTFPAVAQTDGEVPAEAPPSPATESPTTDKRQVVVWVVNDRKLPGKRKKTVAADIGSRLGERPGWTVIEPTKKAAREASRAMRRCKPAGSMACAKQYAERLGASHVIAVQASGTRKKPQLTLVVYDVGSGEELGKGSVLATNATWDNDMAELVQSIPEAQTTPANATQAAPRKADESALAQKATTETISDNSETPAVTETDAQPVAAVQPADTIPAVTEPPSPIASTTKPESIASTMQERVVGTTTRSDLGLSLAPKLGGTYPTSKLDTTYFAGLDIAYQPPFLGALLGPAVDLGAGLEVAYIRPRSEENDTDERVGDYMFTLHQRILMIAIEGCAALRLGKLRPYGSIGYGFYFLKARVQAFGRRNGETQVRSGLQVRGGAGLHIWKGEAFAELRYHYVGLTFATTGDSNGGGITLGAGYRFIL